MDALTPGVAAQGSNAALAALAGECRVAMEHFAATGVGLPQDWVFLAVSRANCCIAWSQRFGLVGASLSEIEESMRQWVADNPGALAAQDQLYAQIKASWS